ncbi:hypothetical protein ACFSL6_15165 [Paenibacillus thailandensis]|uniref:CYTH domain-containing protein n=1 Tax=Paenibacillus thailandensis TaxID=393250 RepID=A0ABW5QRX3_9BACL
MNRVISFSINPTEEEKAKATMRSLGVQSRWGKEWQSEVYFASIDGRIPDDAEVVNVEGWAFCCETNTRMMKLNREENLINEYELKRGYRGIFDATLHSGSRRILKCDSESQFEKVMQDEERISKRAEFEEFDWMLTIEHGVNIRTLISKALSTGLRRYVNRIRYWIEQFEKKELIEFVLKDEILIEEFELKDEDATFTRPNGVVEHNEVEPITFEPKKFFVDIDERFKRVV